MSTTQANAPEFSVTEVSSALKKTVEGAFSHVRVRGEVSGLKRPPSGHLYFDLKDDKAVINGVCWKGVANRLKYLPEDGLEVIVNGKITTYAPRSNYQLVVETIEPAGAGALMAMLEERRKKLAAEGLFDAERKKPIPFLPRTIGVVTSPTGAVIRDILHRLADRFPSHVVLWPVLVQGDNAAPQIARAIRGFNALGDGDSVARPDVLIVARGGGSLEDLWAFNEEEVVRAAAESDIPLISAVGHETDTTLIDYASDLRTPTPTAAAEKAVPVRVDLLAGVHDLARRRLQAMSRSMEERQTHLRGLVRGLPSLNDILGMRQQRFDDIAERLPRALMANTQAHRQRLADKGAGLRPALLQSRLQQMVGMVDGLGQRLVPSLQRQVTNGQQRIDQLSGRWQPTVQRRVDQAGDRLTRPAERLAPNVERRLADASQRLEGVGRLLGSLGYQAVLSRGYAVVRNADDAPVMASAGLQKGEALSVEFADGRTHVQVMDDAVGSRKKTPPKRSARKAKPKTSTPDQGDLF